MMTLEWIRRNSAEFDGHIDTYIGGEGPILELEEAAKEGGDGGGEKSSGDKKKKSGAQKSDGAITHADGSLGIGSLKGA